METVVRMNGVVALIAEKLGDRGYFQTKSEAFRTAMLELGHKYGLTDPRELEDELAARKIEKISRDIDAGKRTVTPLAEVLRESRRRK